MRRLPLILLAALLLAVVAVGGWWLTRGEAPLGEAFTTPQLALEALEKSGGLPHQSLYSTPALADWLATQPGWSAAVPEPERLRSFAGTTHDPKAWRRLDRQQRFDAVWLVGDPAEFRPLLDHLRDSPDWTLVHLDWTSYLFRRRPASEWQPAQLEALQQRFASANAREQVVLRVQAAQRLAALLELEAAKKLLDEAVALDADSAEVQTQIAVHEALQGRWEGALAAAQKATELDRDYLPAQAALANALFAFGRFPEALAVTRRLVKALPEDGPTLYLHAKVTNAARAFGEEVEVLQKIIAINEARQLPTTSWRVYLGQALAATGEAAAALEMLEAALKAPDLHESERDFAEKAVERLQGRRTIQ